jgi:hypothetical protein
MQRQQKMDNLKFGNSAFFRFRVDSLRTSSVKNLYLFCLQHSLTLKVDLKAGNWQGCQMVNFHTKNAIMVYFRRHWDEKVM